MKNSPSSVPKDCPICGASVPRNARSCPECGADERSGWNEDATRYDGLDLPDSAFEDDDAPKRPAPRAGLSLVWTITALVLLLLIVLGSVTLKF